MTVEAQTNTEKPNDKEYNFRALEAKFKREMEKEQEYRSRLEKELEEVKRQTHKDEDQDDESEPYVDHKKLNKKLSTFEKKLEEKIDQKAEEKARRLVDQTKRESWLESHPDFYDVMQNNAQKFADKAPQLAEIILKMPDSFERQQLVYNNIKALKIDKSEESSIKDKIDNNKKQMYYQPSNVANAPYNMAGDFSPEGQKQAFNKMRELQSKMRLG